jgi:catechol 2,3-dioxygenase-like lactoylglutathione lyase family enzyme
MSGRADSGPLGAGTPIAKMPATDLSRARDFYRDVLGLEPVEEREGGLRYRCGDGEFHLFLSSGAASGESTQMGFEVGDIEATVAALRRRGLEFEAFDIPGVETQDGISRIEGNYASKGRGERGVWFRDSEGNLIGIGEATA